MRLAGRSVKWRLKGKLSRVRSLQLKCGWPSGEGLRARRAAPLPVGEVPLRSVSRAHMDAVAGGLAPSRFAGGLIAALPLCRLHQAEPVSPAVGPGWCHAWLTE